MLESAHMTGPLGAEGAGEGTPMGPSGRVALLSLAAAALIGLLGDQLIFAAPGLGLGSLLWVAALVASAAAIGRWGCVGLTGEGRWLLAGAVLFATCLTWRASPLLQLLDLLAIGICLGLAALTSRGTGTATGEGSLARAGVLSYPLGLMLSAALHIVGPFSLLFADVKWRVMPRSRWSEPAAAVGRGLAIALPLLLLFGLLFVAADAVFESLVHSLFRFDLSRLFGHLFGILFFAFLAAGFLRTVLLRQPGPLPAVACPNGTSLGAIETGVILGLLNLLFLAFVLVQVGYLFGGEALVLASSGLTYAEYARRGFFELVLVSALVLPVLLALHWLIPPERQGEQRLFRWLGTALVVQLFVIMASALQRMFLYQQEYGLTELRIYATAFMGWMALLFLWFLATVVPGRRERFAAGALATGLLVLAALHALNPDALIVRTNLARTISTGRFDINYATSLGPDSVPALVEALPQLSGDARDWVVSVLQGHQERLRPYDWRGWNWGRAQALRSLEDMGEPAGG